MITLRTYLNPLEAGMAKSLLESHQIVCSLADENSNLYAGTGQIAIPIRLLVADEQAEQARHILDDPRPPLPDDFDPGQAVPGIAVDANQKIVSELGKLRRTNRWIAFGVVVVFLLSVYLISELPRRSTSPWNEVNGAMNRYDYSNALNLAKALSHRHPKDYYAHEYLGNIYQEMGDLDHAEEEYSRAYELSPPQVLQEKLKAVRQRRQRESILQPKPAATPTVAP
jgi:tetratricopeptide (TPR) repeat protein